jgi:hypothetical protein
MERPKEFLEGYDPQIKELGYDNYSYTPQQVIDRLEAYSKEEVKESDCFSLQDVKNIFFAGIFHDQIIDKAEDGTAYDNAFNEMLDRHKSNKS